MIFVTNNNSYSKYISLKNVIMVASKSFLDFMPWNIPEFTRRVTQYMFYKCRAKFETLYRDFFLIFMLLFQYFNLIFLGRQ